MSTTTETAQGSRPLDGKVALVTGGSRGIGAAIARRLASDGAAVAITYRQEQALADDVVSGIRAQGGRALVLRSDAADPHAAQAAIEDAIEAFGRIDILVNNAGVFPFGDVTDVSLAELEETLNVHVRGVFVASQVAARHLPAGGRIISIGSCFAERVPYPGVALYAMTKSALLGLTKGLARDLGPRGISVTVVHPGNTDTDMNPAADADPAELELIALGRYGQPDDVAATVAHLAGPAGDYITGTAISVDGGYAA